MLIKKLGKQCQTKKAKYQKIYDQHNKNFNKASAEMQKRGLDGKGW